MVRRRAAHVVELDVQMACIDMSGVPLSGPDANLAGAVKWRSVTGISHGVRPGQSAPACPLVQRPVTHQACSYLAIAHRIHPSPQAFLSPQPPVTSLTDRQRPELVPLWSSHDAYSTQHGV